MERRYQGRWDVSMMADCCWSIKREAFYQEHKRKSSKQSFATNQKRKHSDPNYSILTNVNKLFLTYMIFFRAVNYIV
jgi:hypothetical protein